MKNTKSGINSSSVTGTKPQYMASNYKQRRRNIIVFLLLALVLVFSGYMLYKNNRTETAVSSSAVLNEANKLMAEYKYEEAYKLLEKNDKQELLVNKLEFYVLISRAAVAVDKKDKAVEYAKKGAELYTKNPNKDPKDGYILQSILSGTYVEGPYKQKDNEKYQVPKEQIESTEFQG
jgi:tetratricopeptide (TPR) repeat protein